MLILSDVHDIAERLKEIDGSYSLHYNVESGKYELHGGRDDILIVYPYDAIDARMVEHARRTRRERIAELVREMERANEAATAAAERARDNRIEDVVREGADKYYAERRRKGEP